MEEEYSKNISAFIECKKKRDDISQLYSLEDSKKYKLWEELKNLHYLVILSPSYDFDDMNANIEKFKELKIHYKCQVKLIKKIRDLEKEAFEQYLKIISLLGIDFFLEEKHL